MTEFNRSQVFNGSCAPFIYIEGCTSRAKQDYLIAARFWVAANSLALIAMVVVFIRRYLRVKERFNTLRLAMICFAAGLPLYVAEEMSPMAGWVPQTSNSPLLSLPHKPSPSYCQESLLNGTRQSNRH